MKKLILCLTIFCLISNFALSLPLTPEDALSRVYNGGRRLPDIKRSKGYKLEMTHYCDGKPVIYIFTRDSHNGFIVVSADNSSKPLLGYSDNGYLNSREGLPEGFTYWLDELGCQIAANRGTYKTPDENFKPDISPLLTTMWDQGDPYNRSCPATGSGRCPTGCVATAMAQTLKYYNYPDQGIGTHSYTYNNRLISFNYGETSFEWQNMPDVCGPNSNISQINAVSKLMYACGVGVDMMYTSSGSGAYFFNAVRALTENFGYDAGMQYHERNYYNSSEWEEMVYESLRDFGPVMYGGNGNDIGHAFVCDGYKSGYYHFNWGWGGLSDGYFLLTALNPESEGIGGSGDGYNFDQHMITHLKPASSPGQVYEQMLGRDNFKINTELAKLDYKITASCTFYNFSSGTLIAPSIGLLFVDIQSGKETFVSSDTLWDIPPTYGFQNADLSVNLPSGLSDGSYEVYPAFICKEGTNKFNRILMPLSNIRYYDMAVKDGYAYFSPEKKAIAKATDIKINSDLYIGYVVNASALITNIDNKDYFNNICLVAFDDEKPVAKTDPIQVDLSSGSSVAIDLTSSLSKIPTNPFSGPTECKVYVCQNGNENDFDPISEALTMTVYPEPITRLDGSELEIEVKNDKQICASALIKCNTGYFAGYLPLYIYEEGIDNYLTYYYSDFFAVSANSGNKISDDTSKINFDFTFDSGEYGKNYRGGIFYKGSWLTDFVSFHLNDNSGIEAIYDKQEPVTTEYFTITGLKLEKLPQQRGIYIVRDTYGDGHVNSRTVIK